MLDLYLSLFPVWVPDVVPETLLGLFLGVALAIILPPHRLFGGDDD